MGRGLKKSFSIKMGGFYLGSILLFINNKLIMHYQK